MSMENWIEIELGEVCTFIGGGTPSKQNPVFWGGDIPWASIKDLKGDNLQKTQDSITEEGLQESSASLAYPNEIIIGTRINPGRPIISKIRTAINQDLKVVRPKITIHTTFLFYAFKFSEKKILKSSSGTTVLGVRLNNLCEITIPLAPLPEQRAIVSKIEQLFSELDNGIANLKAAKAKLDIYRQAVLKKAFEGELTREWRERNGFNGWEVKEISEIGEIVTGNTPSKKDASFYSSSDYNFYKPTDLEAGNAVTHSTDKLSLKGYNAGRKVPANSILVTCIGATIGKTGLVKKEGGFNQQINAIIPNEGYDAKFIYYQAIGIDFQTQIKANASATTLPILNKGKFAKLEMVVCSKEEQTQIVQEIESRLSVCDNILANIDEGLEKAEALRQSILKKAFEGRLLSAAELEACRKEPDWAPAAELLARIRKEK